MRKAYEDRPRELEHLQGCFGLYHSRNREEIELYKEVSKNFKKELSVGLEALRRGLVPPNQLNCYNGKDGTIDRIQ